MKSIELKGTVRKAVGKKDSKAVRNGESVPCILYGGKESVYFSVVVKELKDVIYTPDVCLVDLNIDGKTFKAKIQDLQFHPVSDDVLHIDFYEVTNDKTIEIELPVQAEGNSIGVKEGGKLVLDKRKLKVRGVVKNLPNVIAIDVTELGLGKSFRVSDLTAQGYEFLDAKSIPVISVKMTRAAKGAAAEAAKGK